MKSKQTTPEPRKHNRVINLIILDESGSMTSMYNAALEGMNSTIENVKKQQQECPDIEQRISIVTFNSDGIKLRYRNVRADEARPYSERDFRPEACTPLYDAMGKSLVKLEPYVTQDDAVIVTIITDGLENSSREFSGYEIHRLVDRLTEKGWLFTYVGANQDAFEVGKSMGISVTLDFKSTEEDACFAYEKMSRSRDSFNRRLRESRSDVDFSMCEFMKKEVCSDENFFDK